MPKNTSFHDYIIQDVMGTFAGVTSRPMFGGWALYLFGTLFGLIVQNELYFKVNERNKKEYVHLKSHPFTYINKKGTTVTMPYWSIPDEIQNDKEQLMRLMKVSLSIGLAEEEQESQQVQREYNFQAIVWEHEDGSWRFISIPVKISNQIRTQFSDKSKGWDSIPVQVTVGLTSWKTSIFFSKSKGGYILPIKKEVRVKEKIEDGKKIDLLIVVLV